MSTRTITIEVLRTVQVRQFEPVSVKVCETITVDADDDVEAARNDLYREVTRANKKFLDNEILKAKKSDEAEGKTGGRR